MKSIFKTTIAAATLALLTLSFSAILQSSKSINTEQSSLTWKGYKITGSSHEGTIAVKEGQLDFENETLTGGNVTIDMNSIACTDLSGKGKMNLEGHLKSDDFFGIEKFPVATINFTNVTKSEGDLYNVTADLTIKGKTHSTTFDLKISDNKANVALKIDRTKFDIRYGSASFFDDLKNKAISDEFDIVANLVF